MTPRVEAQLSDYLDYALKGISFGLFGPILVAVVICLLPFWVIGHVAEWLGWPVGEGEGG